MRRAAKVGDKRPSEFRRQAAEEKALAVLREAAGENLRTDELEAEYRRAVEYRRIMCSAAKGDRQGVVQGPPGAGARGT